jgi:transcription antitermination factor NusA-like protein
MNWKSDFELGGGILRFYGIHLIAVLTALNYENCKIIKLKNNAETIVYKIISLNKPIITISINIDSHIDKFAIKIFDDNIKKKKY